MSLSLQILKKKTERLEGGEFRNQYMRSLGNNAEALMLSSCITGDLRKKDFIKTLRMMNSLWRRYLLELLLHGGGRRSMNFKKLQSLKLKNMGIIMKCFEVLQKQEDEGEFEQGDIFKGDEFSLGVFSYEHPEVK